MAKSKKEETGKQKKEELKNFDIKVNKFGEVITSHNIDEINEFLDEKVDDKKLSSDPSTQEE